MLKRVDGKLVLTTASRTPVRGGQPRRFSVRHPSPLFLSVLYTTSTSLETLFMAIDAQIPGFLSAWRAQRRTRRRRAVQDSPTDTIQLKIDAAPTKHNLSFKLDGYGQTCRVQAKNLTIFPPVGRAFCGTMFGFYSFGRGEPVLDSADFTGIHITKPTGELGLL